jgi:LCP family protein required for cell wall assembly
LAILEYVVFHPWRAVAVLLVGILLGTSAFYFYELNIALGAVATEEFDPNAAREGMSAQPEDSTTETTETTEWGYEAEYPEVDVNADPLEQIEDSYGATVSPQQRFPNAFGKPVPDDEFDAYLLVGTDASGFLADAIILGLQPTTGGTPIMVSLPRDLYLWNLCKGRMTRLNEGLNGCKGVASGSEMMAIMVEDYTGIPIDHLARIDFGGFGKLVDSLGGITVCVDRPTRDVKAHLEIKATGCQIVDGETALAWVRSRSPEQLRSGAWVRVAGSDFSRQTHQQDVLFQLAAKAGRFSTPASLATRLSAVAKSVKLDSAWTFSQAIRTGWRYRELTKSSVDRFTIKVNNYRTSGGAAVLLPTQSFTEQLAGVYEPD